MINKNVVTTIVLIFGLVVSADSVFAQGGAAGLTDEIGNQFKAYMKIAIQLLSAAAFLIVGYGVIVKFMSAIGGRAEWGEVILPVVFGAAVLIISAYMFTEAQTLTDAIGT